MQENRVDKKLPDIRFDYYGGTYIIDVAFCKDKTRERAAFDNKINKYSCPDKNGNPLYDPKHIIPVIINYRGYINGKSRKLLEHLIPELDQLALMTEAIKQIVYSSYYASLMYTDLAKEQYMRSNVPLPIANVFKEIRNSWAEEEKQRCQLNQVNDVQMPNGRFNKQRQYTSGQFGTSVHQGHVVYQEREKVVTDSRRCRDCHFYVCHFDSVV